MAEQKEIEPEVHLHRYGQWSTGEFERQHATFLCQSGGGAGSYAEERQLASSCECFQLAAGESDSVDFVKAIGEVRDPQESTSCLRTKAKRSTSSVRRSPARWANPTKRRMSNGDRPPKIAVSDRAFPSSHR